MIDLVAELLAALVAALPWLLGAAVALVLALLLWPVIRMALPRMVPLALTLAVMSLWGAALLRTAEQQPPAAMLDNIRIEARARPIVLGRKELMQNPGLSGSAAEQHVQLTQERGTWSITNVAIDRRLRLGYVDPAGKYVEFDSSLVPLRAGDELRLTRAGGEPWRIAVTSVSDDALTFEVRPGDDPKLRQTYAVRWLWRGLDVRAGSRSLPPCSAGWFDWLPSMSELQRIAFAWLGKQRQTTLLQFGGLAQCASRGGSSIALAGTDFAAATLVMVPGVGFSVRRDNDPAARLIRDGHEIWLARPAHDLRAPFGGRTFELRDFIAGYTKYEIRRSGAGALEIVPVERSQRVSGTCDEVLSKLDPGELGLDYRSRCRIAPQTIDTWSAPVASVGALLRNFGSLLRWWTAAVSSQWRLLCGLALAILVASALARVLLRRLRRANRDVARVARRRVPLIEASGVLELLMRVAFLAIAVALVLGWFARKFTPSTEAAIPLTPWPALAAWAVAALAVATARGGRLLDGLIVTAWTVLLAVGHVGLVSLTLASSELRSLRFADDTTATIALIAAIVIAASEASPRWIAERVRSLTVPAGSRAIPRGVWACVGLISFFLFIWFAFGSEAGIRGALQPSEPIKTLTIVLLAASVTTALERDRGPEGTLAEFWKSLGLIALMLAVILMVPISRNDLSPFLILVFTAAATFLIVVLVHWVAVWSEMLLLSNPNRAPPPDTRVRGARLGTWLERWRERIRARTWWRLKRLARRPEPVMIGLFLLAAFSVGYAGETALSNARETRQWLMTHVSEPLLNKPVERIISWLEFNARPDREGALDVEFADVGLQVNRSRLAIAASGCQTWRDAVKAGRPVPALNPPAAVAAAFAAVADWVADLMPDCSRMSSVPESEATAAATAVAARMPEIQNDFISTWVIVCFGRDGATGVVLAQCLLLTLMLLAGFLAIKWSPGQLYDRPAAAVAGFATVGFAVTLGLQWTISWQNALGLLPVMGQPATFLSHGPSHLVLFGTPAVLSAVLALRMRSVFRVLKPPPRVPRLSWWHAYLFRR